MKKNAATAWVAFTLLSSGLMISGCSNTQVSTELQLNHPANADAEESIFVRPPNPFTAEVFDVEPKSSAPISDEQKKYREGSRYHRDMQTMKHQNHSHDSPAEENKKHHH